jgi:hypothetical protein
MVFFNLIGNCLLSQTNDELETQGWSNGKAWELLDTQSKITYLVGIENGLSLYSEEITSLMKLSDNPQIDLVQKLDRKFFVTGFRFTDLVQQVNRFYDDRSNIRIPIAFAYYYVIKKMLGSTQDELNNYASELRRKWNN